jgi:hypothetical protein
MCVEIYIVGEGSKQICDFTAALLMDLCVAKSGDKEAAERKKSCCSPGICVQARPHICYFTSRPVVVNAKDLLMKNREKTCWDNPMTRTIVQKAAKANTNLDEQRMKFFQYILREAAAFL